MEIILSALHKLGFNFELFLFNFLNFVIIFLLLNRYLFPVIAKAIEKRKKTIEDGLENAEKAKTALLSAEESKNKIVAEAKIEANNILFKANTESGQIISESSEKARNEARNILQMAEVEIENKKQESIEQVKKEAVDIIVQGIGSFVLSNKENQADFIKSQLR